jgi:excisionase family DNA binding protein
MCLQEEKAEAHSQISLPPRQLEKQRRICTIQQTILPECKEIMMKRYTNSTQRLDPAVTTQLQKLLKVEEVADILGVSRVKVYLLLRSGLPSVKIDGARRFQPEKVQAWIEQHSA